MPTDPVQNDQPPDSPYTPSSSSSSPFREERRQNLALIFGILLFLFFLVGFFSVYLGRYVAQYVTTIRRSISLPHGLDPSIISSFPTFSYSSASARIHIKCINDCAVCLAQFSEDQDGILRLLTACGHVFHTACIDLWLGTHTTCPVCRCDLEWAGESKEVSIWMPEGNEPSEEEEEDEEDEEEDSSEDESSPKFSFDEKRGGGMKVIKSVADMATQKRGKLSADERLMRSSSTGHSLQMNGEDDERLKSRGLRGEEKENVKAWKRSRTWSRSHTFGEFYDSSIDI